MPLGKTGAFGIRTAKLSLYEGKAKGSRSKLQRWFGLFPPACALRDVSRTCVRRRSLRLPSKGHRVQMPFRGFFLLHRFTGEIRCVTCTMAGGCQRTLQSGTAAAGACRYLTFFAGQTDLRLLQRDKQNKVFHGRAD